ncbi:gap-Pol polyprotein, partial [Clonorchis sinensis]
ALTRATTQAVIEIDRKRALCLIDTGAGVSLRWRGNQAERRPCELVVRAVGGYRLKIDGLSMHSMRLDDTSVQHTSQISPDIEQTILGADFLKSTDSVIDLRHGKLVTSYGAVKLEGYPSTAASNLHVRKLPSCDVPSVQSVVKEYSELFTGDEDPFGFCPWIEHEIPLSSERFQPYGPRAKVKWKDHQNTGRSGMGSRKLGSRWQGPFVVTDCRGNVYTIQDGRGSKRVKGTQLHGKLPVTTELRIAKSYRRHNREERTSTTYTSPELKTVLFRRF